MAEDKISRGGFIRFGGSLGVGIASASILASCGGGSASSSSGGSSSGGSSSGGSGGGGIAQESDVGTNSAVRFQNDGDPAVLVRLESGKFVAYSAVCTHQGCTVEYQKGEGTLNCPCHGSVFDPAQGGEVKQGPAEKPLPDIPIKTQNGSIVRA